MVVRFVSSLKIAIARLLEFPGKLRASSLGQNCIVVRNSNYFLAVPVKEPPQNPKEDFRLRLNYYYCSQGSGMGSNYGLARIAMKSLQPSSIVIIHDGGQIEIQPKFVSNELTELVMAKPVLFCSQTPTVEGAKVTLWPENDPNRLWNNFSWFCK